MTAWFQNVFQIRNKILSLIPCRDLSWMSSFYDISSSSKLVRRIKRCDVMFISDGSLTLQQDT